MYRKTASLLRCPGCASSLDLRSHETGDWIEDGALECPQCQAAVPVTRGIPRFVPYANYAANFGRQWNLFRRTQLDSHSGVPISRDRFIRYTGHSEDKLRGALVLDAGCGAGRFAEIALSMGARVIAIDYSSAIDAARANLHGTGDIDFIQADINRLPFAPGSFPNTYCLGVLQHTPDPEASFAALARIVAPGGHLAVDVYPAGWKNLFFAKYWIRPIVKRWTPERSLGVVQRWFPTLFAISDFVRRIPLVGHYLRYLVPVANYRGVYPLSAEQHREWALLDTFDMWAPAFDQPQTLDTLGDWFVAAGFPNAEIFHAGFNVGRGIKAPA